MVTDRTDANPLLWNHIVTVPNVSSSVLSCHVCDQSLSNPHGTMSCRLWKPRGAVTGPMCMPPSGQGLQGPRRSGLWVQRCPLLIQSGGNSGLPHFERQRTRVWLTPCQMGWTHAAWGSCLDMWTAAGSADGQGESPSKPLCRARLPQCLRPSSSVCTEVMTLMGTSTCNSSELWPLWALDSARPESDSRG